MLSTPTTTNPTTTTTKKTRKRVITATIPDGPDLDDFLSHSATFTRRSKSSPSTMNSMWRTATVFFFVGFIWHSTILPRLYASIGPEIAAWIALSGSHVDAFRDPQYIDPKLSRQFGFAGAASHTIIFMFGFVCSTFLRTIRFSSIVRGQGGRLEPVAIGVSLVLVVWTAAVFHVLAQAFCRYAFETKFGPVYQYATLFYEEANGKTPFAWASSVSFTTALLLGLFMSNNTQTVTVERVLNKSLTLLLPFSIWLGLLDNVLIPIMDQTFLHVGITGNDAVQGSHAFAFSIGMIMMFASSTGTNRCCTAASNTCRGATEAETEEDGVLEEPTYDLSNLLSILQSITMTLITSATLLGSMLYTREEQYAVLKGAASLFLHPLVVVVLTVSAYVVYWWSRQKQPLPTLWVDFVLDQTWPRRRRFFTYAVLVALWNVHMFPFLGCWAPFHLFSYLLQSDEYTQMQALKDGTLYAFTGPYCGPVVIQGILKIVAARFKFQWNILWESLLAFFILIPPCFTMYLHWQSQNVILPLHIFMSLFELVYLLTWRNRPEYSGWRDWPQLRRSRVWKLIEDYFQVSFVLDGFDTLTPDRARIMGFHPHGLFPCTVVWMHLIPRWQHVFPGIVPKQLTDAFTHVPPGMREVMQWSGGREITKSVMLNMLSNKETLIIVPGGQSEMMMHTSLNLKRKQMFLCAKHRGFLRIAMERKAELVPILSFGELVAIKNVELPTIQRFLQKLVGVPAPFLPVGIKGFLPLPVETPFSLVFGKPIDYFCTLDASEEEEDFHVEAVHKMYFSQLREMFEAHKEKAGFGDWTLVLKGFDDVATAAPVH